MKMKAMTKAIAGAVASLALVAGGASMALAAGGEQGDTASYGFASGQTVAVGRAESYAVVRDVADDEQREALFAEQGIGVGGAYADAEHLDADDLLASGQIDERTAAAIEAYAAEKHGLISDRFAGMAGLSPQERHERFASFAGDGFAGDSWAELVAAGIVAE